MFEMWIANTGTRSPSISFFIVLSLCSVPLWSDYSPLAGTSCPTRNGFYGALRALQGMQGTKITNNYGKAPVFGGNGESQLA